MAYPSVSFAIPVLNSARVLRRCLQTIREQDYPADRVEIAVADGGSTDRTLDICRAAGVRVVPNRLRTGEAGKLQAARACTGDLIAFVDSDNWLEGPGWLRSMVAPFEDPQVFGAEPVRFTYDPADTPINRYCALAGVNDPLCLFTGNYDRMSSFTGRWTEMEVSVTARDGHLVAELEADSLPTLGANGVVYRRAVLEPLLEGEYLFDVDVIHKLLRRGHRRFAKVDCGIGHDYCPDWPTFVRKQYRRVNDYWKYLDLRDVTAHDGYRPLAVRRFIASTLTTYPLIKDAARVYRAKRDPAVFWHIPLCWTTLVIYATRSIRWWFRRKLNPGNGRRHVEVGPEPARSREN